VKRLEGGVRSRDRSEKPAKGRFRRSAVLSATLLTSAFCFGCKGGAPESGRSEANLRCYDYEGGKLRLYSEGTAAQGKELGSERPLPFKNLGIKSDAQPLSYFCTRSGHLFWVTDEHVFIRRIALKAGSVSVEKVLDARHVDPDEYAVPGTRIISADIWRNPDGRYDDITVATLSNTGLFQAARYSLLGLARNDTDRAIYDLRSKLKQGNRWPEGIERASLRALGRNTFVAIPLGEEGRANVTNFYHLELTAKRGQTFVSGRIHTETMKLTSTHEGLKNIFAITSPIRYNRDLGGWVVNLMGERADGSQMPVFPIVTPGR
jgi:hypothetical protein